MPKSCSLRRVSTAKCNKENLSSGESSVTTAHLRVFVFQPHLGLVRDIHIVLVQEQIRDQRHARHHRHDDPDVHECSRVADLELLLHLTGRHLFDNLHQACSIPRVLIRLASQQRESEHLLPHLILENDSFKVQRHVVQNWTRR
jgi:hypothetical protein